MDLRFSSKRTHSPTHDDNTTAHIVPGQPPARKKVITDDMFTNKMAGLSLSHYSTSTDAHQDPSSAFNTNNHGSKWRKDLVERVDDIDQYLGNDGNDVLEDDDTYLGAAPELVGVAMGDTFLPFERIPGATGLRIPDFVLHTNGNNRGNDNDTIDRAAYESTRKQLHQYEHHDLPSSQAVDTEGYQHQYQPMDLD